MDMFGIADRRAFTTEDGLIFTEKDDGDIAIGVEGLLKAKLTAIDGTEVGNLASRISRLVDAHNHFSPGGKLEIVIDNVQRYVSVDVLHGHERFPLGKADLSACRYPLIESGNQFAACTISLMDLKVRSVAKLQRCFARLGIAATQIASYAETILGMVDTVGENLPGCTNTFWVKICNQEGHLHKLIIVPEYPRLAKSANFSINSSHRVAILNARAGPFKESSHHVTGGYDSEVKEVSYTILEKQEKKDGKKKDEKISFPHKLNEKWWNNSATVFSDREAKYPDYFSYICACICWLFKRIVCLTDEEMPSYRYVVAKREQFVTRETGKALPASEIKLLLAYLEKKSKDQWTGVQDELLKAMYDVAFDGLTFSFEYYKEKSSLQIANIDGNVVFSKTL